MIKLLQLSLLILSVAIPMIVARRVGAARGLLLTVVLSLGSTLSYVVLVAFVIPRLL